MNEQQRLDGLRRLPRGFIIVLIVGLPFCMAWGFMSVLVRDIGWAFRAAWLEAMIERENGRKYMRQIWRKIDE